MDELEPVRDLARHELLQHARLGVQALGRGREVVVGELVRPVGPHAGLLEQEPAAVVEPARGAALDERG